MAGTLVSVVFVVAGEVKVEIEELRFLTLSDQNSVTDKN